MTKEPDYISIEEEFRTKRPEYTKKLILKILDSSAGQSNERIATRLVRVFKKNHIAWSEYREARCYHHQYFYENRLQKARGFVRNLRALCHSMGKDVPEYLVDDIDLLNDDLEKDPRTSKWEFPWP